MSDRRASVVVMAARPSFVFLTQRPLHFDEAR
jgi:hypothetical protein